MNFLYGPMVAEMFGQQIMRGRRLDFQQLEYRHTHSHKF